MQWRHPLVVLPLLGVLAAVIYAGVGVAVWPASALRSGRPSRG